MNKKIEEPQTCTDCGKVLSSKEKLRLHIQRIHGNNKSHDCDDCGKGFTNKNDLKGHINQSHSRKTCESCGKSVLNKLFLKKHLVFDHGITDGAFICAVCPRTMFSSENGYKKHMKEKHNHSGKNKIVEELNPCPECGKVLSSIWTLRRHVQRVHGNDKSHVCDQCGKGFSRKTQLNSHIDQSHSRQTCENCGKSLLNKFFLKKQLVFDHGIKDGAFICEVCPKTVLFIESFYKKHMKEKHKPL